MFFSKKLTFDDIPLKLQNMKNSIKNKVIEKAYSKFDFYYLFLDDEIDTNSKKLFLIDYSCLGN